jgi:hypothetical protein
MALGVLAELCGCARPRRIQKLLAIVADDEDQRVPIDARASLTMRSKSFFFVPSNDLPETFRGGQTCCPVVVGVGDAGMGMMQKRAAEIGVLAAASGDGGGRRGAKQMRAHSYTHRREGGHFDHPPHLYIAQGHAMG